MVIINLTLNNFSELPSLLYLFDSFDNDYEYTTRGVFRRKTPPACPICGTLWFIMAIIHTPNKVLEKSTLVDTNAQIVVHTKKIIVFGKV